MSAKGRWPECSRASGPMNQASWMPSMPTETRYAPQPREFTCAEAAAPTIWARQTSETRAFSSEVVTGSRKENASK